MRTVSTVNTIRRMIREQFEPGNRLPAEHELAQEIGVSRSTVRDALARLAADGIVDKQWGVGTFVAARPRKGLGFASIRPGVPGILATAGGIPSVHRFDYVEGPPQPELFPHFPEAATLSVVRVFALDGVPAVAIRDQMVAEHAGRHVAPEPLRSAGTLVVDVLAAAAIDFRLLEIELWAGELDEEGQDLFDATASEPVIETRGVGFTANAAKILDARGTYRTSVVHASLTVT